MELQRLLIWICFFFCLGLTVGGVLVFFRQKEKENLPTVRFLQYYLIMMYAFAYYVMWSDVFIRLLFPMEDKAFISKISNFLTLISTPFLLIGLIMLIVWGLRLLKKKSIPLIIMGSMLAVLLIVLPFLLDQHFDVLQHTEQLFALLIIAVVLFSMLQLVFFPIHYFKTRLKILLILILLLSAIVQLPLIFNLLNQAVWELGYIFLFFLVNTGLGVYFVYVGDFPGPKRERQKAISFEDFVEKYGITAREEEVILEIYKGKTNREIADCLFVTVQTIKDHTHRIYQKTEVRNRNQLATLLRGFENT
ncbi:DNA-binding CsgD family transcriptional regulator [Catalinimonas alkaloidigena]|uniref:response regulator transcription factor n=1 Tax=Catalinimonas alkaloidigena TaxID=1075417 RepID=UPI00240699AA|nr:helix-turn-helix transcriptional regulator [Catalinimonas alkaloidigena]MDF9800497.1 DNA-binding CsgD family transcriptional regulator [Catalinimonas alkaloidigena]